MSDQRDMKEATRAFLLTTLVSAESVRMKTLWEPTGGCEFGTALCYWRIVSANHIVRSMVICIEEFAMEK